MLRIYNTLTRRVEEFTPINPPHVGMYTCGPTVYDRMHIGNLRTFVFSDILKRVLTFDGYKVSAVMNITDIDDKIIKRAKEERRTIGKVAKEYTKYFWEDIKKLNIEKVHMPRATEYIKEMVSYIEELIKNGFAYEKDGSVYFGIAKFPNYGKLSEVQKRELKTGTRTLSDSYEKENIQDFALWKTDPQGYDSPWGKGRPGWHIECSVMSQKLLGGEQSRTIDLHLGGVDLIFPHHENEIAQSEAKTGKKFVNYFVHGAHLLVDGQKMSKSLNNFYTLDDVQKREIESLALRYLYLQTHYRQEMNFTWEALEGAQKALDRLRADVQSYDKPRIGCAEFEQRFNDAINNDLNMPEALGIVHELINSDYPGHAKAESLQKFDKVLGLDLFKVPKPKSEQIPESVQKLVREREELRKKKRFHLADQLRNKIKKLGYEIQDLESGETEVNKI